MQLAKELCKYGRVAYNSLEEGSSLTMRNTMLRCGMMEVNRRFLLLDAEPMEQLNIRLHRQKAPDIVFIDSFQYTQMSYKQYIEFKESNRNKLLIFISHADGKQPNGRAAKSVMYDATLKIRVEGFRAFSKGRFIGPVGHYNIDKIKAPKYWGETPDNYENNEE
jgi:Predicted ATP-dependent serine protease